MDMTQVFRCQHALAERGGKTAFRHVDLLAYIVIGILQWVSGSYWHCRAFHVKFLHAVPTCWVHADDGDSSFLITAACGSCMMHDSRWNIEFNATIFW